MSQSPTELVPQDVLRQRFEELFHSLPYAILLCDDTSRIIDCNRRAAEQLGRETEELKSILFRDLLPEELRESTDEIFRRLLETENQSFESALCHVSGRIFPVEVRSMRLENGDSKLLELIIRDVGESRLLEKEILQAYSQLENLIDKRTEQLSHSNEELRSELILRKKTEEALRRKQSELREINDKLKENQVLLVHIEKMATLGQMAASISHEINNPMAYIQSNLTTLDDYMKYLFALCRAYEQALTKNDSTQLTRLRKEEDAEELMLDCAQLLKDCRDGVDQVGEIIYSLKNFVRLERTDEQEADLNEGIRSTVKVAWNQIKANCEVEFDLEELPVIACASGQINQVLMNLLINASQAMEDQGVIKISSRICDGIISIAVSDNASGIPDDALEAIFEPFYTNKPAGEGTGLGLAICREIMTRHEGSLEVESVVGEGTTFTLSIPVAGRLVEEEV